MKRGMIIRLALVLAVIAGVALFAPVADAQSYAVTRPGGRGGTWEFFMPLTYNAPWSWSGQGGSSVNLDATWGFGFGFGYNISDHFQMNGLFSWSARNYNATYVYTDGSTRKYGNTEYNSTFSLNGIYYLLAGDISPFVSGGVGVTYIDTSIPNGAGGPTTCWWDPWYGYVCSNGYPTKTETDFSYSLGIGVRFDLNRQFSLQPSYNKAWLDRGSKGSPDFDIWRLDFIFRM
jgi:hypothetical protein